MILSMSCSLCFLPPGSHRGFRLTIIWSLKLMASRARMVSTSWQKIFEYSESLGNADEVSSSRASTLNRMEASRRWMATWEGHPGFIILQSLVAMSVASDVTASIFFGITFQSRAKPPMALGPCGAPALIHSMNSSRSISGSEWRPRSHQRRASKDLSSFRQYSRSSFSTMRLGALKGSAAVSPATMAMASQGVPITRPKCSRRHRRRSHGSAIAM
mmetsp:Transcript_70462/g.183717  ORF Transcript_70462/g.183717 Transcript_70462/m.183717 type:complete len:216 (-) Transcript_70462:12-659(-)